MCQKFAVPEIEVRYANHAPTALEAPTMIARRRPLRVSTAPTSTYATRRALAAALLLVFLTGAPPALALQTKNQQACMAADTGGKVATARTKATDSIAAKCTQAPDFGTADFTGAAAVAAADGARLEILEQLFGDDLDAALATRAGDSDAASCQAAIFKAVDRCWKARVGGYAKCAAAGLEMTIEDAGALAACRDSDADGKIAKACVAGVQTALEKKCEGVDLDVRLPGCTCRYSDDCVTISERA